MEERHVEPTIILEPKKDSDIMKEEIFGCVLPVYPYSTIKEAIRFVNSKDKPLTVYYFGPSTGENMVLTKNFTSSGHYMVNEVLMQFTTHYQGFGGVGASGSGRHGGYEGYKAFSNRKGVLITSPSRPQFMLDLSAPPYARASTLFAWWPWMTYYTQGSLNKVLKFIMFLIAAVLLYFTYQFFFAEPQVEATGGEL